jgi:transposase
MPSLQRYTVKGKSYYRIVESKRINGKPRAIPVMHIGTAEALIKRLTNTELKQDIVVKSFEHGSLLALLEILKELGFIEIINQIIPQSYRGVSSGDALALISINRLLDPCSKNSWCDWAKRTSLFKLFAHVPIAKLSSQFFWEHMQEIPEKTLVQIEDALVKVVLEKYDLKLDLLFFDTTNCYSYLEDPQDEDSLFQYGHSKEKQDHRRLFGVELLVTRESSIPIYHHTYPGNQHDSKLFPEAVQALCSRLKKLAITPSELTLVFDRGNLSQQNFRKLDKSELGFVTGLRLGDIPRELFDIPLQKFKHAKKGKYE